MEISALRTAVRKYCPFVSKLTDTLSNLWWALLPFSSLVPLTDPSGVFGQGTGKRLSREASDGRAQGG